MLTRSAKNKGKRLQNLVREELLSAFSSLQPEDIKVAISSEGGEDVKLSPAARNAKIRSVCKYGQPLSKLKTMLTVIFRLWSSLEIAPNHLSLCLLRNL
jgi:uncharacterized protein (UPF0218 family)